MNRWATMLGIIAAALALVFHFAGIASGFEAVLTDGAVILVGVGVISGY
jgi:hypothetical protein